MTAASAGLRCRGWRQEAILRLLENNLAIAERPEELVVYAAHAKAARDHDEPRGGSSRALTALEDGQTLVIQSGKPVAVLPTGPRAPAVLLANGNLVGRWATPENFYDLERRGLLMWGGLTAGCWQYIGSQGVLQGTYETFAQVAREHFGGTLRGRLVVTAGLGGMGAAQPIAMTRMLEGVCLVAEVDAEKAQRAARAPASSTSSATTIDEALDAALGAREPLAVAVTVNAAELARGAARARRDARRRDRPDRRPRPAPRLPAARASRSPRPPTCAPATPASSRRSRWRRSCATCAALLALRERGAVVFDYGNNIRPHAAAGGLAEALSIDIFTARYLRPLFCRGIGPFRWICLSGEDADLDVLDEICLELLRRRRAHRDMDRRSRARTSPARGCRRGSPGSATASAPRSRLAANEAVADGRLRGAGRVHPRPHGRRRDDPPEHHHARRWRTARTRSATGRCSNALLTTASGADLVALHAGGGGYAGLLAERRA